MCRKVKMVVRVGGCVLIVVGFGMVMIERIEKKILREGEIKKMMGKE
ncbi:hypothetical protein [Bacillus altitudinis]|nr:hypothetical protein [Bacillus altitudinis]